MKIRDSRTIAELIRCYKAGQKTKYVFFWGHQPKKDGTIGKSCFSQWYYSPFKVDNHRYPTAEHYMMAEKARLFKDTETLPRILAARHPGEAKKLGRLIKGFNEETWQSARFDIVVAASYYKFIQNEDLKEFLLATGKRVLVEASPNDRIWGIGLAENDEGVEQPVRWRGLNLLGFALMEARHHILTGGGPKPVPPVP
ncbi:MAG: NADAR family protein [bacterium]|nr:NADAR family protein [bacterium]